MKKLTLSMIVFAGIATGSFAQKDSTVKKPVIKDTIKTKETGAIKYSTNNMLAVAITPEDSSKTKPKPKATGDTLKTGSINNTGAAYYALYSPQTDSVKAKPKSNAADTLKTGTKQNSTGYFKRAEMNEMLAYNAAGPETDSSKTKPATIIKKDSTTTKPADKKTGAIQRDKSIFKNEILEA